MKLEIKKSKVTTVKLEDVKIGEVVLDEDGEYLMRVIGDSVSAVGLLSGSIYRDLEGHECTIVDAKLVVS